jgi:hypothetical protein
MPSSAPPTSALKRLFPFGWHTTLAINGVILVVLFFIYGFWWPYWRAADMDLWMVYEGMLLNDRLPQEYFDHPGYLSILLTGIWFWLGHQVALLDSISLSSLPSPADVAGFDAAWTAATRAGRLLSLLLALIFITGFAMLLRQLVRDWRIAALGATLLTYSGGLAMQARVMRTELISAGLTTVSLLLLLICAQKEHGPWRPLLVGLAAFAATLALVNKVQAILLIAAFPLIALLFGRAIEADADFWRSSRYGPPLAAGYGASALLVAIAAVPLVWFGLTHVSESIFPWRPLVAGAFGLYQAALALWVAAMTIAFARMWRVSLLETVSVLAAIVCGVGLALLALKIRYHPQNILTVLNPIEQLHYFGSWANPELGQTETVLSKPLFESLLSGLGTLLARKTFILQSSPRPTIFLEWFVIAAAIFAWRRGGRKVALQAGALIVLAELFDLASTVRSLKLEYLLYTDALVIVAAALLVSQVPALLQHRFAYPIALTLVIAHVVVSQAEPVKHSFMRDIPFIFCTPHMHYTQRIETYSYCLR